MSEIENVNVEEVSFRSRCWKILLVTLHTGDVCKRHRYSGCRRSRFPSIWVSNLTVLSPEANSAEIQQ